MNCFVASSLGQVRLACQRPLQVAHTFVLQRPHLPYFLGFASPLPLESMWISFGLIHSPQPLRGQYRRFLVVYSWYLTFHFILNLVSKSFSTCLRGMWSAVQHLGGMCCGSVRDKVKIRRRHAWHMRWLQARRAVREAG